MRECSRAISRFLFYFILVLSFTACFWIVVHLSENWEYLLTCKMQNLIFHVTKMTAMLALNTAYDFCRVSYMSEKLLVQKYCFHLAKIGFDTIEWKARYVVSILEGQN